MDGTDREPFYSVHLIVFSMVRLSRFVFVQEVPSNIDVAKRQIGSAISTNNLHPMAVGGWRKGGGSEGDFRGRAKRPNAAVRRVDFRQTDKGYELAWQISACNVFFLIRLKGLRSKRAIAD
ncbi:hypothetical protein N185_17295 [Sinorhizobium sp. GW3]|nr:hypothetical protein N185_17295 [Sinorhizobium sp. GW3]